MPKIAVIDAPDTKEKQEMNQPFRSAGIWLPCAAAGPEALIQVLLYLKIEVRCPVCNGGIDWQRSKLVAAVRAGEIVFDDINERPDALAHFGASLDDVRRRLYATDEKGKLIVGADVAIAIWRLTPGEAWLATLLGNRAMLPFTRFSYDRFADLLFA